MIFLDLWVEEAADQECLEMSPGTIGYDQVECQKECLNSNTCLGIVYSYKIGHEKKCSLCMNDNLKSANDNFGFYRKPQKRKKFLKLSIPIKNS